MALNEHIAALTELNLSDGQPCIEGPSLAVSFSSESDVNFVDRNAYESRYVQDAFVIGKMRELLARGELFINLLYTYRSCSKALPQVKNAEDPNKAEIHTRNFQVLEPEVQKVKDLHAFHLETIDFFCTQIKYLADKPQTDFASEGLLWYMMKLLDLLALLDALLNMKACLVTDFAFYKRAFSFLKPMETAEDQSLHTMSLFLAQQNSITALLKSKVQDLSRYDDVLSLIVNLCATYVETEQYVLPGDKHGLLRVMPYALFVMDSTDPRKTNIFKCKKLNIKRLSTIFKRYPVVPLYGDMQIHMESMIKSCPNYAKNEHQWPISEDRGQKESYEIIHQMATFRQQHTEFMGRLNTMLNTVRFDEELDLGPGGEGEVTQVPPSILRGMYDVLLEGLHLLSDWSSRMQLQCAWKYSHPNTEGDAQHLAENSYEQVVKRNYTKEECFALAELIGMLKGVAARMIDADAALSPVLRAHIHAEMQEFIQKHVQEMTAFSIKKKRTAVKQELVQLRNLGADYVGGSGPDDLSMQVRSKKKAAAAEFSAKIRAVGPSMTQLELLRTTVYGLFCVRFNGKKAYSEKDLGSKELVKALEDFYHRSFFYPFMLDFKGAILEMTDLGDLWYREFYLELTKRLQFPIDLSLPWILADSILESRNRSMMEYVLYPLDIYNDAANRALSSLKQQFLYDEIEAEVNLCFDQLIFKLSDQVYNTFKTQAASLLLDNPYRSHLEQLMNTRLHPPANRYAAILEQRHFQLLGRSVDLNHLMSQRINNYLRKNIDNAISRFEAKDLTSIVELETQLNCIELTHHLLSAHFTQLDSFEALFHEVNDSTSLVSFHSRIVFHVIFELVSDFFPTYNFNTHTQRFVKNPISFGEEAQRENMPKGSLNFLFGTRQFNAAYAAIHELHSQFVGKPHFRSLVNIVKPTNLPLVVDEALSNLNLKIENVLVPYVTELFGAMPPSSKLPRYDYMVAGGIGYFAGKLIDIIQYPPLQEDVFQQFKEAGNTVAFLYLLDLAMNEAERDRFMVAAPLLGTTPSTLHAPNFAAECEGDEAAVEAKIADYLQTTAQEGRLYKTVAGAFAVLGESERTRAPEVLQDLPTNAWKSHMAYRPKVQHTSLLRASLSRIGATIERTRAEWGLSTPEEGAVIAVDTTKEFYRLYSAMQFIYCSPPERGQGEFDSYDLFGDGILWAACLVIHFLQQKDRFNAFDFAYHLLNVSEVTPPDAGDKKSCQFLANARRVRNVNSYIFNLLDCFVPYMLTEITFLQPPLDDSNASQFKIVSTTRAVDASSQASLAAPRAPASAPSAAAPAPPPQAAAPAPPPASSSPASASFPPPPPAAADASALPPPPAAMGGGGFPPPPAAGGGDFPPPPAVGGGGGGDFPPPPGNRPPPPGNRPPPPPSGAVGDFPPPPSF